MVVLLRRTPFHLLFLLFLSLRNQNHYILFAIIPVDGLRFLLTSSAFVVQQHGTTRTVRTNIQSQQKQRPQQIKHLYRPLRSLNDDNDGDGGGGVIPTDAADHSTNNDKNAAPQSTAVSFNDDTDTNKSMIRDHDGDDEDDFWINIGSTITTDSCPLLGIKSLGVDYGLVRTGLALSVGYEPIPLTIITSSSSSNITDLCRTIIQYATTYQVQRIIVGLPLHKNGTIAEQTLLTLNFTQQLAIQVVSQLGPQVSVLLFDERYTSKMAVAREQVKNPKLIHASSQSLYGTLDATAACIILENYYDDNGIGAHTVTLPKGIRETCVQQFQERQSILHATQQLRINNEIEKRQRRLQLLEQAKMLDRQQQQLQNNDTTTSDSISSIGKKRKKKKKK